MRHLGAELVVLALDGVELRGAQPSRLRLGVESFNLELHRAILLADLVQVEGLIADLAARVDGGAEPVVSAAVSAAARVRRHRARSRRVRSGKAGGWSERLRGVGGGQRRGAEEPSSEASA